MGGNAFSETLYTPRMPKKVYEHVRDTSLSILRKFYCHVACPIESPGKNDYGDVDIIVAVSAAPDTPPIEKIGKALNAREFKITPGSKTTNIAVPWPTQYADVECSASATASTTALKGQTKFIQIDLHICPSLPAFEWTIFHQSHGDLWSMLGAEIRPIGLTVSDKAMYIRICELEGHGKELSRVRLTDDPLQVLKFIGLDQSRYWDTFSSLDEMMTYVSSSRFHNPSLAAGVDRNPGHSKRGKGEVDGEDDKGRKMKASDRHRIDHRPAYRQWVEVYLPDHKDDTPGISARLSREEVILEAKKFFGADIAEEFDNRRKEGIRKIGEEQCWADIRKALQMEGAEIGYAMKGLKREIIFGEGETKDSRPCEAHQSWVDGKFDDVLDWANENWKQASARQKAVDQANSSQNLTAKLERMRMQDENEKSGSKPGKGDAA